MKEQFKIVSDSVRQHIIGKIRAAEFGKVVIIQDSTRTLEANAKLHAMLSDISRQCEYIGKKRDVEFWKGLFVSAHAIATGKPCEIVPGLEGEFIAIRESTATMTGKKLSSVIEYIHAWAADQGVKFSARDCEWP